MPGTGNTTVPSSTDDPAPRTPAIRLVPALVLCWSAEEPHRVGEIALLDDAIASAWILGRGDPTKDDPAPRAHFIRQRPGDSSTDAGPISGMIVSRRQLRLRIVAGRLEIESIGKAALRIDGHPIEANTPRRIASVPSGRPTTPRRDQPSVSPSRCVRKGRRRAEER